MTRPGTMHALLTTGADNAPAILAPGRPSLSFAALRGLVDETGAALRQLGVRRGDRLAMVLPNGPEMATGFMAVGCHNAVAPLNPAYQREEFEYYLADLGAAAVLLEAGSASAAVAAANHLGIRIIDVAADATRPAGGFALKARRDDARDARPARINHDLAAAKAGTSAAKTVGLDGPGPETDASHDAPPANAELLAGPDDIALILHTSGTTSRPKIVALTHRNISASAHNIVKALQLGAGDRCLNIMPLFHIHGLMAALLASLSAGGSVFATPGFDALRFFGWFKEARPSWVTAVPTMYQAILRRAKRNRGSIENSRLRLLRSASSSLPPRLFAQLEATFDVPVIESYAMTEAAHQMTSNPLPPGKRIPGTVGLAAGPEVAIMDEQAERLLGPGEPGEVVIRGDNVMNGYEANTEANAKAFAGDWLRTGDQGMMDQSGYLTITGRLKEIINRGGEKISPREVEEVLMDHPAITQAVTFAVPHGALGEEVAVAVVLRAGVDVEGDAIQEFTAKRLATFKVPRTVVVLDEIPKGATGKVQRIGLAEKLGLV